MDIALVLLMIAVGIFAATYGSLVGSAGGFVVVPILPLSPEPSPRPAHGDFPNGYSYDEVIGFWGSSTIAARWLSRYQGSWCHPGGSHCPPDKSFGVSHHSGNQAYDVGRLAVTSP